MWLPEGATMNDAAMIHIGDFITLLNNALTIYMLGVGLLMIIGAGTLAASRLGTGLLVMHIVFWAVRAVVPFLQMGRIPDGNAADLVMSTMLFAASLTVYAVPLFLGRSTGEKYR
jgi:hypothetical protein